VAKLTITEALAEIPTIDKRIIKKQEFITQFLFRQSAVRDPHEKDGGSVKLIEQEQQGIVDLQSRLILIRAAIQAANAATTITIGETTRTVVDWLTWRREVAPKRQTFLRALSNSLNSIRQKAMQQGVQVVKDDQGFTADYIVNINEKALSDEMEAIETMLGMLDGQLSLKNATVTIDI